MDAVSLLLVPGGRIARLTYFLAGLALMVVALLLVGGLFVFAFGAAMTGMSAMGVLALLLLAIVFCGIFYSSIVIMVKRLHDMGQTGWHALWIMIAGVMSGSGRGHAADINAVGALCSLIYLGACIWLLFKRGDDGSNRFGPEPY